jgi:hypothetical protein
MVRYSILVIGFIFLCAVFVGCSQVEEPASEASTVVAPEATDVASATDVKRADAPQTPELAEGAAPVAEVAAFNPPFPDRQEMFDAPAREQNSIRRQDEAGQSVELKGFINVGQPRAVLSIDGVIASVPEGGEKYGVMVRTIEPPKVVLERGRDRWTATLD